jgi:N-acetylneuraminic acid mutarotase
MKCAVALAIVFVCAVASAAQPVQRALTFEERVQAQKAIEEVYWSHRIWPKENPTPRPPLSAVTSDGEIRTKVANYLRKSNALERWWQRPITAEQLQAEIDRMVTNSRDPQVLSELFAALGNDPLMIAETLARQSLADRLIQNWYRSDTRFHSDAKRRAEAALASCARAECMKAVGGDYSETTLRLRVDQADTTAEPHESAAIDLGADEWADYLNDLAATLDTTPQSLPTGRLGALEETDEAFIARAVLERRDGVIVTASLRWPKRMFDAWWASARNEEVAAIAQPRADYTVPTSQLRACTNDTWKAIGVATPDFRSEHTAVWTGSEMIVWGGSGDTALNTGSRYNPSTDTWTMVSTGANVPAARYQHSAVWTGTEMIVWGGRNPMAMDTGGRYNPASDSWTSTATGATVPIARYQHTAVWTGTKMIIWGGVRCFNPPWPSVPYCGESVNTGGLYDPASNTWTPTSTAGGVPSPRAQHTAVWTGTEMIVWGGTPYLAGQHDGGRYNPSTGTWVSLSRGPGEYPPAAPGHTAVWTGTELILWGGGIPNETYTNRGTRYNPSTAVWTDITLTGAPAARTKHTAVWTGTRMIVWGGSVADDYGVNSGGAYDPIADTWAPTSTGANTPRGRIDHSAVWTGTEMIVWGGTFNYSSKTNTGGRYDPSTDSWTATTAPPEPRAHHTALWTGTEMIVWGGFRSNYPRNSGGRYNPSIDTWTATSIGVNSSGVTFPDEREYATAVWTGTEMIVWGGKNNSVRLNTGGRYNPLTDNWAEIATGASNPSARYRQTAVWTGTEMIVWGGNTGSTTLNTGGRYDPVTFIWTPTSTGGGTPAARDLHTAVWTGTEMIVWGGTTSNAGGRYNPLTDSWVATSTGANTPQARVSHTAVWTGTEMIVWGGFTNTGGRYNPLTDSWLATSTGANTPTIRNSHTAVWTGTEMIVWGGVTGSTYLNSGARYRPLNDTWSPTSTGTDNPTARAYSTAVWTGTDMVIWGGEPLNSAGGLYCACLNSRLYYRDADGDGFGNLTVPISACEGATPAGYATDATDCNDTDASVHPNAPEINDGIDNQCIGDPDYGVIDEISGTSGFTSPGDKTRFSWSAQGGATAYDVVRSTTVDFSSDCTQFSTSAPFIDDSATPLADSGFFYLVRAAAPLVGSWGDGIGGEPRAVSCVAGVSSRLRTAPR